MIIPRCRVLLSKDSRHVHYRSRRPVSQLAATSFKHRILSVSAEIEDAVRSKRPVVALESTIYTHGLPYPDNLKLAFHLESVVRGHGAIPATCAVLDGVARVGLGGNELTRLVEASNVRKVSRRDLGFLTGKGVAGHRVHGGTTISGTMILAHLAGIKVFATGGLGGVHRGGESSLDISADLTELGRTPVAVISSGPKGFLDIPRTLEYLETQGALVGTFADGRHGNVDFPAFWARDSGIRSPMTLQDEVEAAAIIYAQSFLPLASGMLFANPVPEEHSIPVNQMVDIIRQALQQAETAGATGNANTPFVLNAIKNLSGGKSVIANRALVESNVIRGAKVAVELSKLEQSNALPQVIASPGAITLHQPYIAPVETLEQLSSTRRTVPSEVDILVAGSLAIDVSCDYKPAKFAVAQLTPELRTSNPSAISDSLGGVGHNVARAAHFMGAKTRLCSIIADDLAGKAALAALAAESLDESGIEVLPSDSDARTARYISLNDSNKDLVIAMSDMSIIERPIDDFAASMGSKVTASKPQWLVVDANWTSPTLHSWFKAAKTAGSKIAFEPVSTSKSLRLLDTSNILSVFPNHVVDLATPNALELKAMNNAARDAGLFDRQDWWQVVDAYGISAIGARVQMSMATSPALVDAGIPQQSTQLLPFIPCILTKLGADGVLLTQLLPEGDPRLESAESARYILSRSATGENNVGGIYMRLFKAAEIVPEDEVVSVNGVGDTFLGALMALLARNKGSNVEDHIDAAQRASVLTLKSSEAVSPAIASYGASLQNT